MIAAEDITRSVEPSDSARTCPNPARTRPNQDTIDSIIFIVSIAFCGVGMLLLGPYPFTGFGIMIASLTILPPVLFGINKVVAELFAKTHPNAEEIKKQ